MIMRPLDFVGGVLFGGILVAVSSYFVLYRDHHEKREEELAVINAVAKERSGFFQRTMPGRPKRIILLRHGQSEGNVDQTIYAHTADNALHLTDEGWQQANEAGARVREIVGPESVHFIVSPYVRSLETFSAVARYFGGADSVSWGEDVRIRELDFGNFQHSPKKMLAEKEERADFSPFFYRYNHGESVTDVYDRVGAFLGSLYRRWENPQKKTDNLVLVCHGLLISVFLNRFMYESVDDFCSFERYGNCDMVVLEEQATSKGPRLRFAYEVRQGQRRTNRLLKSEQNRWHRIVNPCPFGRSL